MSLYEIAKCLSVTGLSHQISMLLSSLIMISVFFISYHLEICDLHIGTHF